MKITESEIIKYIKEEMESDSALADAIVKLSNKIDNLDVSIDYLASALTGEDVLDIGLAQKAFGRFRAAPTVSVDRSGMSEGLVTEDVYDEAMQIAKDPKQIDRLFQLLQAVVSAAADMNMAGMRLMKLGDLHKYATKKFKNN